MRAFTIIKWGLGIASVILGAFCFLYFFVAYLDVSTTQKWPQLTATVDETTVAREERSKGVTYCPKTIVRFQLNGSFHTAELQTSGLVCSRIEDAARQTATDWPRGKTVEIHANPAKPTQVRSAGFALNVADYLVLFVGCISVLLPLPLRHLKAKNVEKQ